LFKGVLLLCMSVLCTGGISFSQPKSSSKPNLEIMEQNISGELEKFFFYPDINRSLQFVFYVESPKGDKTQKRFIESVVRKTAEKNKIRVSFSKDKEMVSTDSAYYKARVDIIKLKTSYPKFGKNQFLGEKSLVRDISSDLAIEITQSSGAQAVKDNITTTYKGEIPYDDFERYQSEEYLFTQSEPPDVSFLESIIFPAAIVAVSAVATLLFFTIRSK
jgi:hypothetical protein